ncbi:MAG: HAMP domain-containing sensor histidine kinase [Patescibacteria group bacterium]
MNDSIKEKSKKYKLAKEVSIVSHQLKTPLSVIRGYLEVLDSGDLGKLNKDQKEYLNDALENTYRMNELIKDLLDISRIEEGKLDFKPKMINLGEIIKNNIKNVYPLAKAKNCIISFKSLGSIPPLFLDPLKIEQVINNLISNAIAYNIRKGKVEVSLKRRGGNIIFCCQDTGVGIPDSEKKKVFKKFYRSESAFSVNTVGSGLGLFISKAIVEKSGGRIWFESKKGKGTAFFFTLPIKRNKK